MIEKIGTEQEYREGQAEVNFLNNQFTVQNACKILRDELLNHGDLYNGFISSIESSLKEHRTTGLPLKMESEIAENILKRIIGEE